MRWALNIMCLVVNCMAFTVTALAHNAVGAGISAFFIVYSIIQLKGEANAAS